MGHHSSSNRLSRAFYEIDSGPTGADQRKYVRICKIACQRCGVVATEKQAGLTDDQLRRKWVTKGWHIGKRPHQHLCPDHARKGEVRSTMTAVVADPPPPPEPAKPSPPCNYCGMYGVDVLELSSGYYCRECVETAVASMLDPPKMVIIETPVPVEPKFKAPVAEAPPRVVEVPVEESVPTQEDVDIADLIFGKQT